MCDTTEPPIIYDGPCPYSWGCPHGCQLCLHDGEVYICPVYQRISIRAIQEHTRIGDYQFIHLQKGGMMILAQDKFDGEYTYRTDPNTGETNVSELECPEHWTPDYAPSTGPGVNHRPEIKPRVPPSEHVYGGAGKTVGIHTSFASHDGVLWRKFPVLPGDVLLASVLAMGDSDSCGHGLAIGVDPTGGDDFTAATVEWQWYSQYPESMIAWENRTWVALVSEATAQTNLVTVFLRSKADYAGSPAGHFDEFVLYADREPEPEPPEPEPPEPGPDTSRHVYELYIDGDLIGSGDFHGQAIGWEFWPAETEPPPEPQQQGGGVRGAIRRWFVQWQNRN